VTIDPANPWGWDAFGDKPPKVDAPEPFKPAPRLFPEEDRLFRVQKNALKAAQGADNLRRALSGRDLDKATAHLLKALVDDAEDTYRTIRSYLEKYVSPGV